MRFKNIFTWTMSALVISMLTFSCTKDSIDTTVIDAPELKLLKEKLPEVHDLIDFNSFNQYTIETNDGNTHMTEGYQAKENGVVVGYYMEMEDRVFYTAITDKNLIRIDLITDLQVIVLRVYDTEQDRLVPNFERLAVPVDPVDLGILQGRNACHDACLAAQEICNEACLLLQRIAYAVVDGPTDPVVGDITILDLTLLCIEGCYQATLICLSLC